MGRTALAEDHMTLVACPRRGRQYNDRHSDGRLGTKLDIGPGLVLDISDD